jgi:hypothetical protein
MDLISWRDFLDEELHLVVEQAALHRRQISVIPPELFENLCADTLWHLAPQIAMQHAYAQLVTAMGIATEAA